MARHGAMRLAIAAAVLLAGTASSAAQPVPPVRLTVSTDGAQANGPSFFDDMTPVGQTQTERPPLERVRNLIFVVDTTNTKPGVSGRIWLKAVRLER